MPPTAQKSTARLFFEEITNHPNPYTFLESIPNRSEPFFEEEWIDFKGYPQDDKNAQRIWSKSLSGFCNTTDGLIIWGIDARKTPPGDIDAACGLRLVSNPSMFESKLREWIRDATNPPAMEVEYKSIANDGGPGFVVCLIPESRHKPHRAEFAEKHYYIRAGDDFLIAPPGLLRTLFYPQNNPYLWLEAKLSFNLNPIDAHKEYKKHPESAQLFNKLVNSDSNMFYEVVLHNTGTATAKDIFIIVDSNYGLNFERGRDWTVNPHPLSKTACAAIRPIHPGENSLIFKASFQNTFRNNSIKINDQDYIRPWFKEKASLHFVVYAENYPWQELIIEFNPNEFDIETDSTNKTVSPSI